MNNAEIYTELKGSLAAVTAHRNQLEQSVILLQQELKIERERLKVKNEAVFRLAQQMEEERAVATNQCNALQEKYSHIRGVIAYQAHVIDEQTKRLQELRIKLKNAPEYSPYNQTLEAKVEKLEKQVKRRNEVLRNMVENHREFVLEIKEVACLERRYGRDTIDPILARLSGFAATKDTVEERSRENSRLINNLVDQEWDKATN